MFMLLHWKNQEGLRWPCHWDSIGGSAVQGWAIAHSPGMQELVEFAGPTCLHEGLSVGIFKLCFWIGMLACFGDWFISSCTCLGSEHLLPLAPGASLVSLDCSSVREGLLLCYAAGTVGPLGITVNQKINNNKWWRHFRCLKLNSHMEKEFVFPMAVTRIPHRVGQEVVLGVKMQDVHLKILAFGCQKLGGGGGI